MAEQLGVDGEDEQAALAARPGALAQARRAGGEELLRLAGGGMLPRRGVVGAAADLPDADPAQRFPRELGVGRVGRVAVQRPEPADRLPVDREGGHGGIGRDRPQRRGSRLMSRLIGAEVLQAELCEEVLEPGLIGTLGKPDAARRPEAAPV